MVFKHSFDNNLENKDHWDLESESYESFQVWGERNPALDA